MQRRTLLKRTGAAITVGMLGGCLSQSGSPGGSSDESNEKSTTTTTTTRPKPSLQNRSLEMVDAGCADGKSSNKATVKLKESKNQVVVTGTIRTPNPCYVAKLANVNYDRDAGTLSITVKAKEKKQEGVSACTQCIGAVEYESTFAFDSGVPKSVTVSHESQGKTKKVTTVGEGSTTSEDGTSEEGA